MFTFWVKLSRERFFFVIILPKKLYLKVGRGWAVEPFFEFDVQEIHEANLANEYFVLANLFFCVDLSLVKRSDGPNLMMS